MVVNFKGFKILLIILIYRDTHEVLSEPRSGVVNSSKKNLSKFPSIYLKSFTEEDSWIQHNATADFQNSDVFENSFVVKNGSDYIIHSDIREVRFACVADYPVMWHIPYPEQFSGSKHYYIHAISTRHSTFEDGLSEPKNVRFEAEFLLDVTLQRSTTSQSGHLACQSIQNPEKNKIIYVYTEAENSIEDIDTTVRVNVTSFRTRVVLPCRPTQPDTPLVLEKNIHIDVTEGNSEWKIVPLNPPRITFNSKEGFIFGRVSVLDLGTYRCSEAGNEETFKIIELERGTTLSYNFEQKLELKSKTAKVEANYHNVYEYNARCCTGNHSAYDLQTFTFNCENGPQCELLKPVLVHDLLVGKSTLWDGYLDAYHCSNNYVNIQQSVFLFCRASDLDVAALYVSAFSSDKDKHKKDRNYYDDRGNEIYFGKLFEATENISIEHKIMANIYSARYYKDTYYRHHSEGLTKVVRKYLDIQYNTGKLYEGASVAIKCRCIPFLYGYGGWLRLNWKNGTRTAFSQETSDENLGDRLYSSFEPAGEPGMRDHYIIGYIEKLDAEMESVDCFFPLWNDESWDNITFKLEMEPSHIPVIEGPEVELISVKMNETGVQLHCNVVPSDQDLLLTVILDWKKDDKLLFPYEVDPFTKGIQTSSGNGTNSTLELSQVTHLSQGTYACIARNQKGEAIKTFKISFKYENPVTCQMVAITVAATVAASVAITILLFIKGRCHVRIKFDWGKK